MATTDALKEPTHAAKMTSKQLAEQIAEGVHVDPDVLALAYVYIDARGTVWKLNDPCPLPQMSASLVIFSIFRGKDEARIYAAPMKEGTPYTRFIHSTAAPSCFVESMGLEVFKSLVGEELRALDSQINAADVEREIVIDYLRTLPGDYPMAELISDIEELAHHETVEEDEGDEGGPAKETETTAPSAESSAPPS
jgi:hypothetical protein